MSDEVIYQRIFPVSGGDFDKAGQVSTEIKSILKAAGIESNVIRRVAIASFEAEMNVVIHADEGIVDFILTPDHVLIIVSDCGPGIEDVQLAMQEGYSTASDDMREMGFGAGMGLPNIMKSCDDFRIDTEVGVGTTLRMVIVHKKQ